MCEGAGFDVDPYGRVFYPNCGQFRVEVVDTNNNFITTFGKYGNEDSGGPHAKVKKPDIPLAWPCYVAVSDTHAYVADTINRRIVRVKLSYEAEAFCEVR
jgi:DNA-binding beta-propeller fold protein YncE